MAEEGIRWIARGGREDQLREVYPLGCTLLRRGSGGQNVAEERIS